VNINQLTEEQRTRVISAQDFIRKFAGYKRKEWYQNIYVGRKNYSTELDINLSNQKLKLLQVALKLLEYPAVFDPIHPELWYISGTCLVSITVTPNEFFIHLGIKKHSHIWREEK
jgi:hypothetical protein